MSEKQYTLYLLSLNCHECRAPCDFGQKEITPCFGSDRVCEDCAENEYGDGNSCFACTSCIPGEGFDQACTASSNTVCKPCVPGLSFQPDYGNFVCTPCTVCERGWTEKRPCTEVEDRICIPAEIDTYSIDGYNYPCSGCAQGAIEVHACNSTHNNVQTPCMLHRAL